MIKISHFIFEFRSFINRCWPNILSTKEWDYTNKFQENWVETLWELLLETLVLGRLPDGENFATIRCYYDNKGIELYPTSNRAFFPECEVTHEVVCLPKNGQYVFDFREKTNFILTQGDRFNFKQFITFSEDNDIPYREAPPFDYVGCDVNDIERVLKVEECNFYIRKVSDKFKQSDLVN
jgi:hypothetical protein